MVALKQALTASGAKFAELRGSFAANWASFVADISPAIAKVGPDYRRVDPVSRAQPASSDAKFSR
jgi:hypothetical protein